ncbi:MAG TPA: hypothetical protein VF235_01550 [Actinomycetota bacterium]
MRGTKRKATIVVAFVGAMLVASVALAAWLASGTGSGFAKATTAQSLTTSANTPTADLYPGAVGDLEITIDNPNPYPVQVTQIARTADPIVSDAGAACDASTGVSTNGAWPLVVAIDIAAGSSTTTTLNNVVAMDNTSDDSCQGATFTVPVTVSGASNA